jgi:hypothetical protein
MATAIFGSIRTVTENRAPARRTAPQNAAEQQAKAAPAVEAHLHALDPCAYPAMLAPRRAGSQDRLAGTGHGGQPLGRER